MNIIYIFYVDASFAVTVLWMRSYCFHVMILINQNHKSSNNYKMSIITNYILQLQLFYYFPHRKQLVFTPVICD